MCLSVEGKTYTTAEKQGKLENKNARVHCSISPPRHLQLRTVGNIPILKAVLPGVVMDSPVPENGVYWGFLYFPQDSVSNSATTLAPGTSVHHNTQLSHKEIQLHNLQGSEM